MSAYDRTSPHRGLVPAPDGCNIAHGKDRSGSRFGGFSKFSQKKFPARILVVARQQRAVPLSDKGTRSARLGGVLPSRDPFFKPYMNTDRKLTDITDRKPRTPSYKSSFRLNEEQNIRFNELLCKVGLEHNRSRLIVKRIFGEEFVVVRRDPSKTQFVVRLNDFYFQFQRIGANYNQVVKVINAHFSNVAIPHQIALLEQRTRELKALSIEILNFAKQAKEWLRI